MTKRCIILSDSNEKIIFFSRNLITREIGPQRKAALLIASTVASEPEL